MGRIHSLLRNYTAPLLGIAGGIAALGVLLLLVARDLPAWPLVLLAAVVVAGAAVVTRPRHRAAPPTTAPLKAPSKNAPATAPAAKPVAAKPVAAKPAASTPAKPAKVRPTWASKELYTPVPKSVPPMQQLAGSQAQHFGIPVVPFDPVSSKAGSLPSFAYKVQESMRVMRHATAVGGSLRILRHDKKDDGYAFARGAGVEVPYIYADGTPMASIDWSTLPDRVVVKPLRGAASRGVFLLEKIGDGRYRDHMDGSEVTVDDVVAKHRALVDENLVSENIVAEEFLMPHPTVADLVSIPDDLKVFTFYDHPAVIMQRRCFGTKDFTQYRFRFWDAEWNDLGPVKYADRIDPHMPAPALAEEVTDVVRRLGKALAAPFARIDVYETARGVVFGEITPHPGPPAGWRGDLDRLLGYEWEIAQARLGVDEQPVVIPGR